MKKWVACVGLLSIGVLEAQAPKAGPNGLPELPDDAIRSIYRDPHSAFTAYVPPGSIARGEALMKTGGSGKTIQCAICHDESLHGVGDVPRIAGTRPVYIFRQLHDIQNGTSNSIAVGLKNKVVANLSERDMIDIAAYVGSLAP